MIKLEYGTNDVPIIGRVYDGVRKTPFLIEPMEGNLNLFTTPQQEEIKKSWKADDDKPF